ncbi:MAG TPA: response regulator transcription factor [Acidimicrobiales bacterium]|nr:response regulator transcription factor [Acidimicrobiales bacterium]
MTAPQGAAVVVEDDPSIGDLVELYLRREGFRVLRASNGREGLDLVRREHPRIVLLDVGLAGELDGFDVCRAIRADGDTPVVFLTAQTDEIDRVLGLELGADDYVTKPFSPRELVARVKAVLRRAGQLPGAASAHRAAPVTVGGVTIDPARREVTAGGEAVELTAREYDLLAYLAAHQGFVLSRQQLLDGVWGLNWFGDERTVDVHVAQLRKKLGPHLPLATVRGVGYRLG